MDTEKVFRRSAVDSNLAARIKALKDNGTPYNEVAKLLTQDGYITHTGKPVAIEDVSVFMRKNGFWVNIPKAQRRRQSVNTGSDKILTYNRKDPRLAEQIYSRKMAGTEYQEQAAEMTKDGWFTHTGRPVRPYDVSAFMIKNGYRSVRKHVKDRSTTRKVWGKAAQHMVSVALPAPRTAIDDLKEVINSNLSEVTKRRILASLVKELC